MANSLLLTLGAHKSGASTRNLTYAQIAGNPPDPRGVGIFSWYNTLLTARLANVPLYRSTVYYFASVANGGNDGNPGTQASPFNTLNKLASVIAANPSGNFTCLFNKGDVWRENQLIQLTDRMSVGSYGSGSRPVWTRCTLQYASGGGGWTNDTTAYYRTEANAVATVIVTGSKLSRPLKIAESVTDCKAKDDSWFWDPVTSRLYVRLGSGPTDPNTLDLEACIGDDSNYHIDLYGNNIRFQGIRLEGYGIRKTFSGAAIAITGAANNGSGLIRITAASHGLSTGDRVYINSVGGTTEANLLAWTVTSITSSTFDLQGSTFSHAYTSGGQAYKFGQTATYGICYRPQGTTHEGVIEDCEVYYTGYHAIGHITAATGGFCTIKGCTTGYVRPGASGGCTNGVGYSDSGSQETIWENHTSAYGNVWETGLAYGRVSTSIYGHTRVGYNSLIIVRGHTITSGTYGCSQASDDVSAPVTSAITDCRRFIIDETVDDTAQADGYRTQIFPHPTDSVHINCVYYVNEIDSGLYSTGFSSNGYAINTDYIGISASLTRNIMKATYNGGKGYYCRYRQEGQGTICTAGTDAVNFALLAMNSCSVEGIQSAEALSIVPPNLSNAANNINYGAYHARDPVPTNAALVPAASAGAGAIGDTHKIYHAAPPARVWTAPYSNSPLVGAGDPAIPVNYDRNRSPRLVSTIGPLNASASARPDISTISSVILWLKAGQYTVGTWTASVGSNWTQSTGANQPAVGANGGAQGGANKYLTGTLGAQSTFTVYAVCVRTTATVGTVLSTTGAGEQYLGIFSDNNAYIVSDGPNYHKVAANCTGTYVGRWTRVPNNSYFRGKGIDAAAMDNATAGNTTFTSILARPLSEYSHSSFELVELIVCNADLRGTSDEAIILEDLYSRLGAVIL